MTIINCRKYYLDGNYLAPVINEILDDSSQYIQDYETLTGYEKIIAMSCKANSDIFGTYGLLVSYTFGLVAGMVSLPIYGEDILNKSISYSASCGYQLSTTPGYTAIMIGANIIDYFVGDVSSQEL
jgi:hypothetical protein